METNYEKFVSQIQEAKTLTDLGLIREKLQEVFDHCALTRNEYVAIDMTIDRKAVMVLNNKEQVMQDRELLELAAKAAEIVGFYSCLHPEFGEDWYEQPGIWYNNPNDCIDCWNPLEYDGDALRLVAKIGLHIGVCIGLPNGDFSYAKTDCGKKFIELHSSGNSESATRRAIVCAAAEIGKSMAA